MKIVRETDKPFSDFYHARSRSYETSPCPEHHRRSALHRSAFVTGCASPGERYVATHGDLTPEVRAAILQQRIVPGMIPDEANATAGAFVYEVTGDRKVCVDNYFLPRVILSRRLPPDNSVIKMTLCNRTQFQPNESV